MIDVIYILGTGSRWSNNELRYSLRSLEKYLVNFGNVYLIGERPEWITNVIHYPHPDITHISDTNQYHKILRACVDPGVSPEFLYVNDDHFLLHPFDAKVFPNFHKGPLIETIRYDSYGKRLRNTEAYLKEKGFHALNFDVHTPILFNKKAWLKSVHEDPNWKTEQFVIKSLYANQQEINYIRIPDCKFYDPEQIGDSMIFSTYPRLTNEMKDFLMERFPLKSRYEI